MLKRPLDQIDRRILAELSRNARLSHAELGERVHLSRNAVRQRIERLELEGVIGGYTITGGRGDPAAARLTALIFVYRHDRMRGGAVIDALRKIPEIVRCDVMSGEFDLVLRIEAGETDRVRQIWEEIAAMDGVRDTLTAFVLSSLIDRQLPA